jgi:CHAT domain-containing protein
VAEAARAAADLHRHLRPIVGVLPEGQALHALATRERPEQIVFSVLLEADGKAREAALDAAWRWALRWHGLVQEEMATRAWAARSGGPPEAAAAWRRLEAARGRLAELWVRGAPGGGEGAYEQALRRAEAERAAAAEELAEASAGYRALRLNRAVTRGDLGAELADGEVLVQPVRVGVGPAGAGGPAPRDVALLLHPGGGADAVDLGPASRHDALVRAWRQALDRTSTVARPEAGALEPLWHAGSALRRALWDPVAERIGSAETVFLVPGGPLALVPVTALPTGSGAFVIDDGPAVRVIDSARDLVRPLHPAAERGRGLLALGAPDFGATAEQRVAGLAAAGAAVSFRGDGPSCQGLQARRWAPLPAAEAEIRRVAALLKDEKPRWAATGARASEARFKRLAPGRRIVHLATHGYFLAASECSEEVGPLLRSGLVLAGASRGAGSAGSDDGVLTAEEVAALDLHGVELVVLSACEAGRGDVVGGEGVLGLRRAFALAGVEQLVLNVWPVPDRWSARWMGTFYRALSDGADIAAAARRAQRENLARLRETGRAPHPYYWSGWMAVGPVR